MVGLFRHLRPWSLLLLTLVVLLIGVYNALLTLDHVRHAGDYRALGVSYPPLLRAGLALIWSAVLLATGAGLWNRHPWARRWLVVVLSNYGAFGVLWMIVFARADFARGRIAFQAVVTALLVGLVAWIMRWGRIRAAFNVTSSQTNPGEVPE
jgi:hypothetical protein